LVLAESARSFGSESNKAYDQHNMQMISLKVNLPVDPLRSDGRFDELMRSVGLPQSLKLVATTGDKIQ
jgi:hypothetical protein